MTRTYTEKRRPKQMWKTRTFWLNLAFIIVTIIGYLTTEPLFKDWAPYLLITSNVINIVVRQFTSQPAAWTTPPADPATELLGD